MARVALLGFPRDLAEPLSLALSAESHSVERKFHLRDLRNGPMPHVVFVCGDALEALALVSALRQLDPDLPVVVATRMPETKHWLDALEAGAADYCGAPFEPVQVRWVMNSVLREPGRLAA